MSQRPIIALDFPDFTTTTNFLAKFPQDESLYVKVGMELFYKEGTRVVESLIADGHDVFLDLKLHDIPNTVHRAMKNLGKLGVAMTNVHAAGGSEMMIAAKEGLLEGAQMHSRATSARLIAVTQLTSTSEQRMQTEQLIPVSIEESVQRYAELTAASGLDGVVCSAWEAKKIHQVTSDTFICLTPGIRSIEDAVGDQQRVVTPEKARELTATYIVIGRPITQAVQPYEKYKQMKNLWNEGFLDDK